MRYFIDLAYNGETFHGWQRQKNATSIQETVENCMTQICQKNIPLYGAGRTDTGVHARQLIAHFDLAGAFEEDQLVYKLNRMLSPAIAIKKLYKVKPDAHARFDAVSREYNYYVSTRKNPFTKDFSLLVRHKLAIDLMNQGCTIIKRQRDFQCFSKVKTDVKTYNCKVEIAVWEEVGDQLVFTVKANRFLRNMVRAMVGTLLEIGLGQRTLADLKDTLESGDRSRAGKSVAAKGLFLNKIIYPESIKNY